MGAITFAGGRSGLGFSRLSGSADFTGLGEGGPDLLFILSHTTPVTNSEALFATLRESSKLEKE